MIPAVDALGERAAPGVEARRRPRQTLRGTTSNAMNGLGFE